MANIIRPIIHSIVPINFGSVLIGHLQEFVFEISLRLIEAPNLVMTHSWMFKVK